MNDQTRREVRSCNIESIANLCHPMVVLLVPSLWRESHSTSMPIPLSVLIWEQGIASSFLTISAERRHQIKGTVSGDHLHSTWWRVITRCCSHTSNIVDWSRLWRDYLDILIKKTRAELMSSCQSVASVRG